MSIGKALEIPIYAIAPGFEDDTFYVGGGGGQDKTGVKNEIVSLKLKDEKLEQFGKNEFEDAITSIDTFKGKSLSYIAAAIGPFVVLMKEDMSKISQFDTKMEKVIFRCLQFSSDGKYLLTVDGDETFRILTIPDLNEYAKEDCHKIIRAAFFNTNGIPYIAAATFESIKILSLSQNLEMVAEYKVQSTPRCLKTDENQDSTLYYAAIDQNRKSLIAKISFDGKKIKFDQHKSPSPNVLSIIIPGSKSVAASDVEGSVFILKKNLSMGKAFADLHGLPITSGLAIQDKFVTGGLGNSVIAVSAKVPLISNRLIFIIIIFIGLILAFLNHHK